MNLMRRILLITVCSFLQSIGLLFLLLSAPMFLWQLVVWYSELSKDEDIVWFAKKMTLMTIPFALLATVGLYFLDVAQNVEAKLT